MLANYQQVNYWYYNHSHHTMQADLTCSIIFFQMQAKIFISRLFQMYRVTLPDDYELVLVEKVVRYPKGDLPCTLFPVSVQKED